MKKEFKRRFMHPTRRKLADMVKTGEYESNTTVGWDTTNEHHNIGDIWEDEFHKYEQKDGYIMKTSKNSDAFQEIREYLQNQATCKNPKCTRAKKTAVDKKLIKKTGYCVDCLAVIETKVRHAGVWDEYQNYKIWTRMLVNGKIRLEQLKQALIDAKQVYEYVNEDGSIEKWTLPQPLEEMKADLRKFIETGKKEITELEVERLKAFEIIKSKNCEHYL